MTGHLLRQAISTSVVAILLMLGSIETAQAEPKDFSVPAQSATTGIPEFARQAGIQILVSEPLVHGKQTTAVTGMHSVEDALVILLRGTGLIATSKDGATFTVVVASAGSSSSRDMGSDKKEGKKGASQDFPVAHVDQNTPGPSVDKVNDSLARETDQSEDSRGLAEILVKGSRIMNVDVKRSEDDPQPYTILTSEQIQRSGAINVEDFLKQQLTMNTAVQTNSQAYGLFGGVPGGTSSINLRGLGANETLILIDGRRTAGISFVGSSLQPDINGIPLAAIERIEVLPSSASAIYGGAAVGGVVNVILKKNFEGGRFDASYENTTNASAPLHTVDGTYGFSLESTGTQVMLAGHYSDGKALLLQDRLNLTQRGISTILNNSPSYFYNSSLPFSGATPNIAAADGSNLTLKDGTPLNAPITSVPAGTAPGQNISAGLLGHAGNYNLNLAPGTGQFGLQSPIGTVPTVKSLMATVRQQVTSSLEGFVELSTLSNSTSAIYNPFTGADFVPSAAPDNPFQQDVLVDIPNQLSPRLTSDSVTQSVTTGLIQRLPGDWSAELDYTWSRNSFEYAYDTFDTTAFSQALASGVLNPFVDTIAHPFGLDRYLAPNSYSGNSTLNDVALRVSGPIGSFSWGQPTLTVGLEHRKEGTKDSPYLVSNPLTPGDDIDRIYFGQSQSINSIYVEALVPLVTPKNAMPLLRSLDLQLAGRSERYTVFTGTGFVDIPAASNDPPQGVHNQVEYTSSNPTIALKYKPENDIALRASYAKAFLPPTAGQLLPNPTPNCCDTITDPKNGETYDVNVLFGGSPSVKPQTSTSWDLGAIWEPQEAFLRGLRINVEYYKIAQPNYIAIPGTQQIVSARCASTPRVRSSDTTCGS